LHALPVGAGEKGTHTFERGEKGGPVLFLWGKNPKRPRIFAYAAERKDGSNFAGKAKEEGGKG